MNKLKKVLARDTIFSQFGMPTFLLEFEVMERYDRMRTHFEYCAVAVTGMYQMFRLYPTDRFQQIPPRG